MKKELSSIQQWECEGGMLVKQIPLSHQPERSDFDHKEPPDDDCGLPESPIYSNYVKYLWTSHRRSGGVQSQVRSRDRTGNRTECEPLR